MFVTFARLQRLSGLERPSAIKKWLQSLSVGYLKDSDGNPFTTLEAFNRRLQPAHTNNQLTESREVNYDRAIACYQARNKRADGA